MIFSSIVSKVEDNFVLVKDVDLYLEKVLEEIENGLRMILL